MSGSEQTAIIILAAGESSRMGQPKQLLRIKGKTLLRHAVDEALSADIGPVIVVLGAFSEMVEKELNNLPIKRVINSGWQQGMGASIRKGIIELQEQAVYYQGAIIMLSDQPYADAGLLKKLLDAHHLSRKLIIASAYKETLGVPAYFHHSYFTSLMQLERQGARKLIQERHEEVEGIPFSRGGIDIDTPEDYKKVKKLMERKD